MERRGGGKHSWGLKSVNEMNSTSTWIYGFGLDAALSANCAAFRVLILTTAHLLMRFHGK